MWYIVRFFDNIIKLFQYAWFVIVPVIILIILLIKKEKKDKNNHKDVKKILVIIYCLVIFVIVCLFTIRMWGPNLYKKVISFSICNKEIYIEKKLEDKYGKNFNYVSQDDIVMEKDSEYALGQDINDDYSVRYIFKDDDGVIAIVKYKKNYQSDYYESKRSKYEIEKKIYDYAKEIDFNKKFYVYVESPYELTSNSNINDKANNNILEKQSHDRIIFILTEQSDDNQVFIVSILKNILGSNSSFYVHEHVVTDSEYDRAVNFYNSVSSQNGIVGSDYEEYFDFNKNNEKQFKYYFINQ